VKRERWQQIDGILQRALELSTPHRDDFLNNACAGDEVLRKEVESLLASHDQANDLYERPAFDFPNEFLTKDLEKTGDRTFSPESDPNNLAGLYQNAPDKYIGTVLKDRYLIEKELGQGGISVVYLAYDKQLLSRPVVVKVLKQEIRGSGDHSWFKKKLRHEIEALARVDHPGVVGVLDIGEVESGEPFFVMQYIDGVTLRSIIKPEGVAFEYTAYIMQQLTQALAAAHNKGIYHRDLKPENIMVQTLANSTEQVKLIDFGIAKVENSQLTTSTNSLKVAGTLGYMAPEQLMGKPSAASDIYALGVIAYEMITGRRPFNPYSPFQLYEMQKAGVKVKPIDLRPSLSEEAQDVLLKALLFEPQDRYSSALDFGESFVKALTAYVPLDHPRDEAGGFLNNPTIKSKSPLKGYSPQINLTAQRVAILYKRNTQPDEQVLKLLETELTAHGHDIFIDRHMTIGIEWAKEIEQQIQSVDAVIPLLSSASVLSEMLAFEVQLAYEAAQQNEGKPRLLPVRLNYDKPLPDPLACILDPIQFAVWKNSQDDQLLTAEVLRSLKNPHQTIVTPPQHRLEPVGGAVPLDSEFYIVRSADNEFRSAIDHKDSIVLVKGARQMGKTSLLARGLKQARKAGVKVIITDFQKLNATQIESIETLFFTLAGFIAEQLDLDVMPEEVWNSRRGASMNFERFIRREVLGKIAGSIVWGLDEVDRLFTCDYGSEVFGLFRSWHNERAINPEGPWQRFTLAIVYATEAHLFITDLNQSPFNVGTRLVLEDFNFEQVSELNRRHDSPLKGPSEVARFFRLVGGHPYLVRRGLHEMVSRAMSLTAFEGKADRDEGPYGDHLRRILVLLAQDKDLSEATRKVLQGHPCPTSESFYRLRSAGVLTGESAREARPRSQLYAKYLERHLL
jgi:serine/threonine protein kinase